MTSDAWTDERMAKLKTLWLQGLSCSQIAAQLGGGISRNAVIGKRVRMGLPDRIPGNGHNKGKRMRRAAKPSQRIDPFAQMKREPVAKIGAPKLGPRSVRFKDRLRYQCAMFCEGEEGALGFVCGQPTDSQDHPWCAECWSRVFVPNVAVKGRAA